MRRVLRGLTKLLVFAFFSGLLATLRYILNTPQPLESVLPGEAHIYTWKQNHIFYKVLGPANASPLVLLHSPEIGGSSYEMRYIMERLAQHYHIYVPDLLGFGLSDHPRLDYSAHVYVTLYQDFLKDVVKQPATLLATGLSCNYSVALAARTSNLCARLILLSPTSLFQRRKQVSWLAQLIQNPTIDLVIYSLLTPRFILRRAIAQQRKIEYKHIGRDELNYLFASAHQLGAQHTALAFLSGKLGLEITHNFEALAQPTLIIWAMHPLHLDRSFPTSQHTIAKRMQIALIRQAGSRVHEEQPEAVVAKILDWQLTENLVGMTASTIEPALHPMTILNLEEINSSPAIPVTAKPTSQPSSPSAITPEFVSRSAAEDITRGESIEAYCVKCRQRRSMHNPQKILTKNKRSAMEGICPICGTKLFRFIGA